MTPYEIRIMLHYYTSPTDYEGEGEPILGGTLEKLRRDGLLKIYEGPKPGPLDEITDKGRFYCEGLTNLPIPTQRWEFRWAPFGGKADA